MADIKKYLFWPQANASYEEDQIEQIIKASINDMDFVVDSEDKIQKGIYFTPTNIKIEVSLYVSEYSPLNSAITNLIKQQMSKLFVDKSKTNNDKKCIFTCQKYEKPHILNLNGRYYSKMSIIDAIEKTLKKGDPLRLEDVTILPGELPNIKLYPIYKPTKNVIKYTEKDVIQYNLFNDKWIENDCPDFSKWMAEADKDGNNMLDIDAIASKYYAIRPIENNREGIVFKNVVIKNILFPKYHHKNPATYLNVKFENCVINWECFCGPVFISCLFKNCRFVRENDYRHVNFKCCNFDDCIFIDLKSNNFNLNLYELNNMGGKSTSSSHVLTSAVFPKSSCPRSVYGCDISIFKDFLSSCDCEF